MRRPGRRKGSAVRAGLARRRAAGKRTGGNSYALTWRRNENDERETIPDKAPVIASKAADNECVNGSPANLPRLKPAQPGGRGR